MLYVCAYIVQIRGAVITEACMDEDVDGIDHAIKKNWKTSSIHNSQLPKKCPSPGLTLFVAWSCWVPAILLQQKVTL